MFCMMGGLDALLCCVLRCVIPSHCGFCCLVEMLGRGDVYIVMAYEICDVYTLLVCVCGAAGVLVMVTCWSNCSDPSFHVHLVPTIGCSVLISSFLSPMSLVLVIHDIATGLRQFFLIECITLHAYMHRFPQAESHAHCQRLAIGSLYPATSFRPHDPPISSILRSNVRGAHVEPRGPTSSLRRAADASHDAAKLGSNKNEDATWVASHVLNDRTEHLLYKAQAIVPLQTLELAISMSP
jgi:hypothetical protein